MGYLEIDAGFIFFSEDADAVAAKLNTAIDWIDKSHIIFWRRVRLLPRSTVEISALWHALDTLNTATAVSILTMAHMVDTVALGDEQAGMYFSPPSPVHAVMKSSACEAARMTASIGCLSLPDSG